MVGELQQLPGEADVGPELRALSDTFGVGPLLIAAKLLLSYELTTARINEEVVVEGTSVRRTIEKDFFLPPAILPRAQDEEYRALLLPVMTPRRRTVVDFLQVEGPNHESLTLVRSDVSIALAKWTISVAFDAWAERLFGGETDQSVYQDTAQMMRGLKAELMSLPALDADFDLVAQASDQVLAVSRAVFNQAELPGEVDLLLRALHMHCQRRPILALLYDPPRALLMLRLRISYRSHNRARPTGNRFDRRLRELIGQRPYSHFIPTPHAYYSQSYYVRIEAPPSHYVSSVEFVRPKSDVATERYTRLDRMDVPDQDYSPRGLNYAHARLRAVDQAPALVSRSPGGSYVRAPLGVRVVFHEIPPGATGVALTISFLALLAVGAVGSALGPLLRSTTGISDIPALLVAVPGLVALAFGPTLEWDRLVSAPMMARISLVTTGLLTFAAAASFIVWSTLKTTVHKPYILDRVSPYLIWWVIFIMLAIQTAGLLLRWLKAHRDYRSAITALTRTSGV